MEEQENEGKICLGQYFVYTADASEHPNSIYEYREIRPGFA